MQPEGSFPPLGERTILTESRSTGDGRVLVPPCWLASKHRRFLFCTFEVKGSHSPCLESKLSRIMQERHQHLSDLAQTLLDRAWRGHRPPIVVLAHDLSTEPAASSSGASTALSPQGTEEHREPVIGIHSDVDMMARNPDLLVPDRRKGDRYLVGLLSRRYLATVIHLGLSHSLDEAIAREFLLLEHLRLVRNEHSDDYIARALSFDQPRVKLLRLRGDIVGRSPLIEEQQQELSGQLQSALKELVRSSDLIWVGPLARGPDASTLREGAQGIVWWCTSTPELPAEWLGDDRVHVLSGSLGDYDAFFRELCIITSRRSLTPVARENRKRMNTQVRARQPIDLTNSDRLIQRLAHEIRSACDDWREPTLLAYIHDPDAPGGSEVERRIGRYLRTREDREPDSIRVSVRGSIIRWVDRHAEQLPNLPHRDRDYQQVVVVDSISFTGHTMKLASDALQQVLPRAEIYWAALIVSEQLVSALPTFGIPRDHLLRVIQTDRHDIFFPWGWTQATSPIVRHARLHATTHDILISQRPWGTIEVLAEETPCSVRLHTIRAGHRLSYHQHALRDELFVALDDGIGIEFDSEDGEVVEAALMSRGEYLAVPRGVRHRFAAYRDTVRLLEIGFGLYDQVYDIERFADDYGRLNKLGDV